MYRKANLRQISSRVFNVAAAFLVAVASVPVVALLASHTAHAYSADAFVIAIDTTKVSAGHTSFVVPTSPNPPVGSFVQPVPATYDYTIDCDDTGAMPAVSGQTGDYTCNYAAPGVYTIAITGDFPYLPLKDNADSAKSLMKVKQWGAQEWLSMAGTFKGAVNMTITASDKPNLTRVTSMSEMFSGATSFNQDISNWNVSNVRSMGYMFHNARSFNQPLNSWDTSEARNTTSMFYGASSFNQPLNSWDMSKVGGMEWMFADAKSFNQPLNNWNVSGATQAHTMFSGATSFNSDVSGWEFDPRLSDLSHMFNGATAFNQNINDWKIAPSVTKLNNMFEGAKSFNQPLDNWNVSSVKDLSLMFSGATAFNQPIGGWDTRSVTSLRNTFTDAVAFNQPLNNWDVSKVTDMTLTFARAYSFNQPLDNWNTGSVTTMSGTFSGLSSAVSAFNQSLEDWDISSVTNMQSMLSYSGLSRSNYENTLAGWSQQSGVQDYLTLGATRLKYCDETGRNSLITNKNWTIQGDILDCSTIAPTPVTEQDLSSVAADPSIDSVLRNAILRVSDANASYQGCSNIDTAKTQLLSPSGVTHPTNVVIIGGVSFTLTCTAPGGATTVSIELDHEYPDTTKLIAYKYVGGVLVPTEVTFVNRNGATFVEFTLTDGLMNDEDGAVNGVIVDPLYIGVRSGNSSTPSQPDTGATDQLENVLGGMVVANQPLLSSPNTGSKRQSADIYVLSIIAGVACIISLGVRIRGRQH